MSKSVLFIAAALILAPVAGRATDLMGYPLDSKDFTLSDRQTFCKDLATFCEHPNNDSRRYCESSASLCPMKQDAITTSCIKDPATNESTCNYEARTAVAKRHGFADMPHAGMSEAIEQSDKLKRRASIIHLSS